MPHPDALPPDAAPSEAQPLSSSGFPTPAREAAAGTIRQCAPPPGGLGTRLGSLTDSVPKPMLVRGGRPFLAWLLRELCRFGVTDFLLLTGHLSEALEQAIPSIQAHLPRRVTISVSREPVRAGTGGALFHARDRLGEKFLLCNGDSLFDTNLGALLADA